MDLLNLFFVSKNESQKKAGDNELRRRERRTVKWHTHTCCIHLTWSQSSDFRFSLQQSSRSHNHMDCIIEEEKSRYPDTALFQTFFLFSFLFDGNSFFFFQTHDDEERTQMITKIATDAGRSQRIEWMLLLLECCVEMLFRSDVCSSELRYMIHCGCR